MEEKDGAGRMISVLIVEDDEGLAELIREGLEEKGLSCSHVRTGREAVAWLSGNSPDLVLLDYSLPDITGSVLVDEISGLKGMPPFIMITGHGDEQVAVRIMKLGARDYLVKDMRLLDMLPDAVLRVLQEIEMERKLEHAEEALKESEKKFRRIFADSPIGIALYDCDGRLTCANAACMEILGVSCLDEFKGFNLFDDPSIPHCDHDRIREGRQVRYEGLLDFDAVRERNLFPTARSGFINVDVLITPVNWRGGDASTRYLVHIQDITARKALEERLKAREERLSLALYGADDGLWDWNVTTAEVYYSPQWMRILGYDSEELAGHIRSWEKLAHPDDAPEMRRNLEDLILGRIPNLDASFRILAKSGDWKWVLTRGKVVSRSPEGKALRVVGTIRDISRRKQLEQMLIQAKEAWERTFDAVTDSITVIDPEFRVMKANRAAASLIGKRPEDVVGKYCYELYHDPPEVPRYCPHGKALKEGRDITVEICMDHSPRRYFLLTASPVFGPKGEVLGAVHVGKDITGRKELEAQVRQTQKLESLGVVAGGIAHDFNNFLMGIFGYADLALEDSSPESPLRPYLQRITEISRRMADVCNQILAYTGKGFMTPQPMDLSAFIKGIAPLLAAGLSKKALAQYDLANDLPAIRADSGQLSQLVMNLMINASEALGDQPGSITVRSGAGFHDCDYLKATYVDDGLPAGRYVYLEITDTGCGMDADTVERIFDPFFTTKFTGRGLGLAVVLGIVRGHQGAIKVRSAPGGGSTFTVLLPAVEDGVKKTGDAPPGKDSSGEWEASGLILVTDDDEQVRDVVTRMLERRGFDVVTAEDGLDAVEVFRRHGKRIRAIILDLTMPGLNGEEACREIRRLDKGVPVLVSSGYSEEETLTRFQGLDVSGFIQKPYMMSVLAEKLESALNG